MYKSNSRWSQMRGNKRSLKHRAGPTFPTEQDDFNITRNLVPGPGGISPSRELARLWTCPTDIERTQHLPAPGPAKQPRSSRPSTRVAGTGTSSSSGQQSSDPSTMPVPPRGRRINQRRRNLECHVQPPAQIHSRGEMAWRCHPQSVATSREKRGWCCGVCWFVVCTNSYRAR